MYIFAISYLHLLNCGRHVYHFSLNMQLIGGLQYIGVTIGEKATILDKIEVIADSRNMEPYLSQCDILCKVMPDIVRNYCDDNWHSI